MLEELGKYYSKRLFLLATSLGVFFLLKSRLGLFGVLFFILVFLKYDDMSILLGVNCLWSTHTYTRLEFCSECNPACGPSLWAGSWSCDGCTRENGGSPAQEKQRLVLWVWNLLIVFWFALFVLLKVDINSQITIHFLTLKSSSTFLSTKGKVLYAVERVSLRSIVIVDFLSSVACSHCTFLTF